MRILILAASAGAGHLRAAQALEAASRESRPDVEVMNVDALDRTPKLFKKWYAQSYLQAVNHIPKLWGYFYEAYDRKTQSSRTAKAMRVLDRFNNGSVVVSFGPPPVTYPQYYGNAWDGHHGVGGGS